MTLLWMLVILAAVVAASFPLTRAFGRRAGLPLGLAYLAVAAAVVPMASQVLSGEVITERYRWVPSLGADLELRLDGLGVVFLALALVIGAVVFFYSVSYLGEGRQLGFYAWMTAFTLSMAALVVADNLVLLFLCWELTSLASFFLIARSGHAGEAASMRTMSVTFLGGLTMIAAVAMTIAGTGTANLTDALGSDVWADRPVFTGAVALLVAVSGFTKAAQFPFHVWLPDAMAAATPVSAYLHAAAVVKAGIYLLLLFSTAFHGVLVWNLTLITVGLLTAALGAWFALHKTDLKKLMAYSTVSQLGLITATIGVGTPKALTAATLHTIAHALFKAGLFMMVGVIDHATGTRDLRRLPALRRAMPVTFWTVVVGTASMAGVPPLIGFVSKESILAALREAPGGTWVGWAALAGAVFGAVLTFSYCAKIVFGAFVDGTRELPTNVHEGSWRILLPAAAPIWVGLPLALAVGVLDVPIGRAVSSILPDAPAAHLTFWHGVNLELGLTLLVIAVGVVVITQRARWRPALDGRDHFGGDGATAIAWLENRASSAGLTLAQAVRADHPTRHTVPVLLGFGLILGGGALALLLGGALPSPIPGQWRWIDVAVLLLVALGTLGVMLARSRMAATIFLGGVGIAMTVQIFGLGAPDVGLTQLLVEVLTVVVIMLVLRKLPIRFTQPTPARRRGYLSIAVFVGAASGLATWVLTGRRERSDVAQYYLDNAADITGGDNIVNVILVEFRALDTLGELTVLGMAGIAILAVLGTIRAGQLDPPRRQFPRPLRPLTTTGKRYGKRRGDRSGDPQAVAALTDTATNARPMQLLLRMLFPLLIVVSIIILWRGHNEPGGGFIAALIAAVAVALRYLSAPTDAEIGGPAAPGRLIGGGVLIAVGTGLAGFARLGFLEPLHGYVAGIHLSSSLLFDLGVYAAVLGLVVVAIDLLGSPPENVVSGPRRDGESDEPDQQIEDTAERVAESLAGRELGEER